MNLPKIFLLPGREKSLLRHHQWIFSGAVGKMEQPDLPPGETVMVCSSDGQELAIGAYSPHSQLRIRVWSFDPREKIDAQFFRNRIADAVKLRQNLGLITENSGCRLIYSESDRLPGLIVDRYCDTAVVQFLCAGSEFFREIIIGELMKLPFINCVYDRSDSPVRKKENLPVRCEVAAGKFPGEIVIDENGLLFSTDPAHGQKTGFYFDLRDARNMVRKYARNKKVLNVFSYTGGFACAAFAGGAGSVLNIDSSAPALEQCRKNLLLNNFNENWENRCGDAFKLLRQLSDQGEKFDLVILDPPKLIDSRNALMRGCRGYQDLARLGFKLLNPGGILFNFSCSGLMTPELFQKITASAAEDAGVCGRIIARTEQSPDHPTILAIPETFYLKGLVTVIN